MRNPSDIIGRAHISSQHRHGGAARRVADALLAPLHLVLPVALLMSISAAAYLYGDMPVKYFAGTAAQWITPGHLLLPLTFLAIHITNRRYGAGFALAQVIGAWALGGAALWYAGNDMAAFVTRTPPQAREIFAFGGALFVAQIFCVLVFDRTRGPRWWQAPLLASLWGAVLLCLIAFPAAYAGTNVDWVSHMLTYLGINVVMANAMVLPYWAIRGMVPPMSGFGGY
ncbi:MAG TPA: hypothetical protein VGT78_03415 [Rhizomicrobium sp.]|nr:hypothetical protein [Rhizomicrobium sp.]